MRFTRAIHMIEVLGFFAYNLGASIFGVYGAYRGVIQKRDSTISMWELVAIFFLSWFIGTIGTFLLLLILTAISVPTPDPTGLLMALVIIFFIARRMIEHRERINK
jgi:hypothetical protein